MASKTLDDVLKELGSESAYNSPPTTTIQKATILQWMSDKDMEVAGAVYHLLTDAKHYPRIEPPFSFAEFLKVFLSYGERCILEDPQGEWADSRWTWAYDLVNCFDQWWEDETIPREALADIKNWLARVYRNGDDAIRTCVVQGTLEHLLEDENIRQFFTDWNEDPTLRKAYAEAMEWATGGGHVLSHLREFRKKMSEIE